MWFPTSSGSAERATLEELAPRFAATYDLNGNGKTVVRASWGKYLDQIGTGTPGPNPNGAVSQRYNWNDLNGDLVFPAWQRGLGRGQVCGR